MIQYKNLVLIGTSHISPESIKEVRKIISETMPTYVAVELDKGRLLGLMGKKEKPKLKDMFKLGFKETLFVLFGSWLEEKLGKMVGTKPGDEMKVAVKEAAKIKAKILLIDQEINITVKRLFKYLSFKEKMRFVLDLIKGFLGIGEKIRIDLRKVPEQQLLDKMILQVKDRYPNVYKVLIAERNEVMAKRLVKFMEKNPTEKIVAVVGAGHENGMIEIIKAASS
ncbi:TraB/GumN family protein [Candidatus Woesearchaeota archaeon]|nr:TraB/GumN family protein [Candidatus Woesearchaeota archaeon]